MCGFLNIMALNAFKIVKNKIVTDNPQCDKIIFASRVCKKMQSAKCALYFVGMIFQTDSDTL